MNQQSPEKLDIRNDGSLEIVSIFETIQGEGPYAGSPAVFVRTAGCDLQCPACDTQYTKGRYRESSAVIADQIAADYPNYKLVVITGGEPFRQNIVPLCLMLRERKLTVQVETNGTLPLTYFRRYDDGGFTIVCSPKTSKVHQSVEMLADAWKYILDADHIADDGLPTESLGMRQRPARPPESTNPLDIYVQPLDTGDNTTNRRHVDACVEVCRKHGYRFSPQIHKLIGLP